MHDEHILPTDRILQKHTRRWRQTNKSKTCQKFGAGPNVRPPSAESLIGGNLR